VSFRKPNGAVMTNMKPPQEGGNTEAPSFRGLQGRSTIELNVQASKEPVSSMWRGLDAGKYFQRSVREKCFSLDIPFDRTSGWAVLGKNQRNDRSIHVSG